MAEASIGIEMSGLAAFAIISSKTLISRNLLVLCKILRQKLNVWSSDD
jgi:hypothetical protein